MKLINKIYLLLIATLALTFYSCQEDALVQPQPSPIVPEGNMGVYFPSTNKSNIELNPEVASDFEIRLTRKKTGNAAEVPLNVLVNTDDVFVVPAKAIFAANQETTTIKITFPKAKSGETYSLRIGIDDENFANFYSKDPIILSTNVAMIVWTDLGEQLFYDSFAFAGETSSFMSQVKLEQRADKKSVYRISYPYTDAIWDAMGEDWRGGNSQEYITFEIKKDNYVTWDKFWYTSLLYQGTSGQNIKAYIPSARNSGNKDNDKKSIAVTDKAGTIQYIHFVPEFYIDGVGGFGLKNVYLSFPGYDLKELLGDMQVIK